MDQIEVRLANAGDKDRMLSFLALHWRADHIFVQSPNFFDWQYRNSDGSYNVSLALNETQEVLGFLGFIPTGFYDAELGHNEIMLAIWKVRDDVTLPGLGIRLLKQIERDLSPQIIGAIGISEMVGPIYKAFKYQLGELSHSALFVRKGSIAQNVPDHALDPVQTDLAGLGTVREADHSIIDELSRAGGLAKSWHYIDRRYVSHPHYKYIVRGVYQENRLLTVIVLRRVEAEGSAILRIVDVIGSPEGSLWVSNSLRRLAQEFKAEYVDLMEIGFDAESKKRAGFLSLHDYPELILPNYFAPFERKNVPVKLAYKDFSDPERKLLLFRGDSDQDRPNLKSELIY